MSRSFLLSYSPYVISLLVLDNYILRLFQTLSNEFCAMTGTNLPLQGNRVRLAAAGVSEAIVEVLKIRGPHNAAVSGAGTDCSSVKKSTDS